MKSLFVYFLVVVSIVYGGCVNKMDEVNKYESIRLDSIKSWGVSDIVFHNSGSYVVDTMYLYSIMKHSLDKFYAESKSIEGFDSLNSIECTIMGDYNELFVSINYTCNKKYKHINIWKENVFYINYKLDIMNGGDMDKYIVY